MNGRELQDVDAARIIEKVARAMCEADGRNPDECGPVDETCVLTLGEIAEGRFVSVVEPMWRHYRRDAILIADGMTDAQTSGARITWGEPV